MGQPQLFSLAPYETIQESESKKRLSNWLVILVLIILPIERIMFPLGLRLVDIIFVFLILYGITEFMFFGQRIYIPLLTTMWMILIASLFATLTGFSHSNSIIAISQEIYIYLWFIMLTNVLVSFGQSGLKRLMKIWCIAALIQSSAMIMGMFGIGPHIFYTPPIGGILTSHTGIYRPVGTFINPNAAAVYLSLSFFVLLATPWPSWLRSIFGIWIFVGIFATGSLGGILSTIMAFVALILICIILKHQRISAFLGIVFGVCAVMFIIAILLNNLLPSLSSVTGSAGETTLFSISIGRLPRSLGDRIDLIERGWSIYRLHPLGTGPNTYILKFVDLHNDYAAFLFERGPLGLIGWLWFIGVTLITPIRTAYWQKDSFQRWQILALGSGFLICVLNAFTHEVSHFRQVWVFVAILFATIYTFSNRAAEHRITE